jgi:hypothetical protein
MPTTKPQKITGNFAANNSVKQGHKKRKGNIGYMHMGRNKYTV